MTPGPGFLVLNDQQYSDFLKGGAGEDVFSADDARRQEVNAGLSPTMNQAQEHPRVFVNNSKAKEKTLVQADFRIEF